MVGIRGLPAEDAALGEGEQPLGEERDDGEDDHRRVHPGRVAGALRLCDEQADGLGGAALRRTVERVGSGRGIAAQEQVDRIFSALRTTAVSTSPGLPSGHSEPTTELICRVLHRADHPLSAHEVAAQTGLSRSTARRYLRRLEQSGRLRVSLRYGDTGRPEHRYAWVAP